MKTPKRENVKEVREKSEEMQIGFAYLVSFLYSYHAFVVTDENDVFTKTYHEQALMAYWLLKTEPGSYSFADLMQDKKAVWDGVSNNLALRNIRMMKKGVLAFIYHSGDEKAIVGVAEVASDPYIDPKHRDSKLAVIDLKPKKQLDQHITLAQVKSKKQFASFELVRIPRLAVMPVSTEAWKTLITLSR